MARICLDWISFRNIRQGNLFSKKFVDLQKILWTGQLSILVSPTIHTQHTYTHTHVLYAYTHYCTQALLHLYSKTAALHGFFWPPLLLLCPHLAPPCPSQYPLPLLSFFCLFLLRHSFYSRILRHAISRCGIYFYCMPALSASFFHLSQTSSFVNVYYPFSNWIVKIIHKLVLSWSCKLKILLDSCRYLENISFM